MQIDAGLDTGPMLLKYETRNWARTKLRRNLYARLAEAGAPLMAETLRGTRDGTITAVPQDNSQATFAPPLKKRMGRSIGRSRRRRFSTACAGLSLGRGRSQLSREVLANLGKTGGG